MEGFDYYHCDACGRLDKDEADSGPEGPQCPYCGQTLEAMCDEEPTAKTFEAVRYADAGHAGEPGDGAVIAKGTLAECRKEIALRHKGYFGYTMARAQWSGTDGDVEAYHESAEEGCGGWAIHPARS